MKKLILFALAAVVMAGCARRLGKKTDRLVNDGHDYQWISFYDKVYFVHSPECDTCKILRKEEIKQYVDSIVNEKIVEL